MLTNKWEEEMENETTVTEELVTTNDVLSTTDGSLFDGWEPQEIEDSEGPDFSKPIKGKYECTIEGIDYREGEKDGRKWENLVLKLKACNDLEGDPSYNRFLDKTYWLGTTDWNDDPDKGKKDLCSALYSSGAEMPRSVTPQAFVMHGDKIKGTKVFVSAWGTKKGDKEYQNVKIVKALKLKEESTNDSFQLS